MPSASIPVVAGSAPKSTDIRIEEIRYSYEDFVFRAPIKFGGVALDRATILNVECSVQTVDGRSAGGFGSMPLGNVWSFPSRVLSYEATLAAMKALAEQVAAITAAWPVAAPAKVTAA